MISLSIRTNTGSIAGLYFMFGLGVLAIGGTISRQITNAIAIRNTSDFTWYWAPAELCVVLE